MNDAAEAAPASGGEADATTPSATVVSVQEALVTIERARSDIRLTKNEVIYVRPARHTSDDPPWLKGEVLRVRGERADAQIYEATTGVAIGDPVEQSGAMLSVELGPGLLGRVYDGLQNPLTSLADQHGTFLPRGVHLDALNRRERWSFRAGRERGERVHAGDVLGTVAEAHVTHKIFAPFDMRERARLRWIESGSVGVDEPVAELEFDDATTRLIHLHQTWPVRRPLTQHLQKQRLSERRFPTEPLSTTTRLIDTFFPVAKGGTACIPGPFGAGKTVLQNLIARFSDVDVVVVVACGERAGEVVETITTFPELQDPKTGGPLMQRTVIICNTSSMPVAARESSVYTGITIGEYYRQMGLDVLLIADSTSRWAQAMRETSGRLEEIPGEEAFPAYLDSAIKGVYERAGRLAANDGAEGTLTLIGTVSPAGGNFEEPVTQATLSTVKTFLGLSADRAYKRFYPAIDPLISWTRYRDQLRDWFESHMGAGWTDRVTRMLDLLKQGDELQQMMQVTGEEGITLDDFVTFQKARLIDMVVLQQDAFDPVDVSAPLDRQKRLVAMVNQVVATDYALTDKDQAREVFTEFTRLFTNLNYAADGSQTYESFAQAIDDLRTQHMAAGSSS
jgi:V/A-type H+-transporting ATPase subunit A